MELGFVWVMRRSRLTILLQIDDFVNERRRIGPRLIRSLGLGGGDDIGGCFFDDAEAVKLQLTEDRGLPCTGRARDDEPSYTTSSRRASGPSAWTGGGF